MKRIITRFALLFVAGLLFSGTTPNQRKELGPGDMAPDFSLPNVDGEDVSLSDYKSEKGAIIFFTSNTCPFATGYESRMVALHHKYSKSGFPVIAINPNDENQQPDESLDRMKIKAGEAGFPFPYLKDNCGVCALFGATRTPTVFLLERKGAGFRIVYTGAIDSQPIRTPEPNNPYLENAIRSLLKRENPDPARTRAVGCTIKTAE